MHTSGHMTLITYHPARSRAPPTSLEDEPPLDTPKRLRLAANMPLSPSPTATQEVGKQTHGYNHELTLHL
jgi:hypothetical protein